MTTAIGTDLSYAVKLLKSGELVGIPTETVYGLAGNAMNVDAVLKIFKAKNRPQFNPLIIHLPDWTTVNQYVNGIPETARKLAKRFTPGPLTFLLEKSAIVPDLVTAGSQKVAIRIPSHPVTQKLLKSLDFPLAAPSANPSGYVSPTTAQHVLDGLGGKISYILDGGPCQIGMESTIIDFENDDVIVRRKGGVAVSMIEGVIEKKVVMKTGNDEHPVAPGQLKSHYATRTPLYAGDLATLGKKFEGRKVCLIEFGKPDESIIAIKRFQLSSRADMDEAAKSLFSTMRIADQCGADVILVNWVPEEGLGSAINDRLLRASHA